MKFNLNYNNRKNLIKFRCIVCGTIHNLENHRIIIGGPYTQENVACLCRKHHMLIHKFIRWNSLMTFEWYVLQAIRDNLADYMSFQDVNQNRS